MKKLSEVTTEVGGWLIAVGSIIINLILTLMSVRVQGAVAEVRAEIEKVRTEMQTLRASIMEKQFEALSNITSNMRDLYMDRQTSMDMHADNRDRLTNMHEENRDKLSDIEGRLGVIQNQIRALETTRRGSGA